MLAGAHRILRLVTRRQGVAEPVAVIGKLPGMRQRRAWGRSILRLFQLASRRSPSWRLPHPYWDFPPLLSPEAVWACRPALLAIAAAPDDQRRPISDAALQQLKTFLTEASVSPLFSDDPGCGPSGRPGASAQLHRPPRTLETRQRRWASWTAQEQAT